MEVTNYVETGKGKNGWEGTDYRTGICVAVDDETSPQEIRFSSDELLGYKQLAQVAHHWGSPFEKSPKFGA